MNFDLEKIKPTSIAIAIMTLFVTVIPGAMFLFLFKRDLFLELDLFKLVILALGITLPFFIINSLIYLIWEGEFGESGESSRFHIGSLAGSVITIPVVYIPLILKLLLAFESKIGILMMVGLELVIIVFVIFVETKNSKKTKSNSSLKE